MKQNSTIVVGLTGGIGSGKSTVSNMLIERNIPVIDADKISREVLIIYPEVLWSIKKEFGEEVFDENDNLDRKKLGAMIFSNEILKKKLENIIIPYIKKEIFDKIEKYVKAGEKLCIVDAPTLIENNLHKYMDEVIVIVVNEKIQIKRVMARDSLSKKDALNRINSQMPLKEKLKYATYTIDNSDTLSHTEEQLDNIIFNLLVRGNNEKI
ncbi:dephospho-CoA kinase [Clostridium argentinense CDC 2741]|uniref:Dephospho-CoA kinase n=1 Tax=Clostridium argentinense CDC 2741 TaxID=1418104 RepID=A0A0C1R3P0_9CLOT|nr:dephospho-CoA kinase [Clostridium argentinense]ARC85090.1 dephospho-CoA kinase [Clostridium argentinense]KIE48162.1 dephospho-CoA kinase [Clostridium argentinense CDC 2741]NFF39615.1 dephospho-CoA kinase [Clostridium argentinense]NFP51280.1 dephospho-CoA kinase [Clostridium argentinense]NFP72802.1 dephospho-CoA kinase [Clostridium argentinense]